MIFRLNVDLVDYTVITLCLHQQLVVIDRTIVNSPNVASAISVMYWMPWKKIKKEIVLQVHTAILHDINYLNNFYIIFHILFHIKYYIAASAGAFCGNKIVEAGEECDCGYDYVECTDKCCYPRQVSEYDKRQNESAKGCSRRAGTQCRYKFLFSFI